MGCAGQKTLIFKHQDQIEPLLQQVKGLNGWKKQQVLKIAASTFVNTPFYLTLDADVVCAKPLIYSDFISGGRGLVQLDGKCGLSSAFNRSSWWSAAARILRTEPRFCEPGVAVTPFLFARDACIQLTRHIATLNELDALYWVAGLFSPTGMNSLESVNFSACGWTEYSLYYLFLIKNNTFNNYHFVHSMEGQKITQLLSRNSFGFLRTDESFESWSPRSCFSVDDPALFFAIQSRSLVPAAQVEKKLRPYIGKALSL